MVNRIYMSLSQSRNILVEIQIYRLKRIRTEKSELEGF